MATFNVQFRVRSIEEGPAGVEVAFHAEEEIDGMQLHGSLVLNVPSAEEMKLDSIRYGDTWRGMLVEPPWED